MVSKISKPISTDTNNKVTAVTTVNNGQNSTPVEYIPMVENTTDDKNKGIPVDSFEYRYKKIIIKKGLDKDNDDYIQENEIPDILDYFEVSDINKLLAKQDTSDTDDETTVDSDVFANLMSTDHAISHDEDSAAGELYNTAAGDLVTTSAKGSSFGSQMQSLYDERKELIKKNKDTSSVDNKIDTLNETVKTFLKEHHTDITQDLIDNGTVKPFKYGKNNEKTGYIIQSFDFKGENALGQNGDNDDTDNGSNGTNNNAGYNVKYSIEAVSENTHFIGSGEFGSENADLLFGGTYHKTFTNNGRISATGMGRYTASKDSQLILGGAVDYRLRKFSCGLYGAYNTSSIADISSDTDNDSDSETTDNDNSMSVNETTIEGYVRHGDSLRFGVGHTVSAIDDLKIPYTFAKAKISGKRNIGSNTKIFGSVEGEYGITNFESKSYPSYSVMGKGGVSFTSKNLKTNIFTNIGIDGAKNPFTGDNDRTLSTALVGNLSTDKVDFTATLTGTNTQEYDNDSSVDSSDLNNLNLNTTRQWNLSSSFTLALKRFFGKKSPVTPSFTYSLSKNNDKVEHNGCFNLSLNF